MADILSAWSLQLGGEPAVTGRFDRWGGRRPAWVARDSIARRPVGQVAYRAATVISDSYPLDRWPG
jgi:hypothetical protein